MHAILVSRMLLHLRKQTYRRGYLPSQMTSLSELVAPNPNLPPIIDPGAPDCPQIQTRLDLGSPLSFDLEWRPDDQERNRKGVLD